MDVWLMRHGEAQDRARSGRDEDRAAALNAMWRDPEVRAIIEGLAEADAHGVDVPRSIVVLLSDLLDLDRLQRGIVSPQRRPTDMVELIHRGIEETDNPSGHFVEVWKRQGRGVCL